MAERILSLIVIVFTTLLAIRLFSNGLYRTYPSFCSYLAFSSVQRTVLFFPSKTSNAYFWIWVCSEPIAWFFYALMFLELYSIITSAHEGIRSAGRKALYIALGAALLGSFLFSIPFNAPITASRLLGLFFNAERTISFSLVIFLATLLALMLWFPITLSRNVILHSKVFSTYFLSNTMVYAVLGRIGVNTHIAGYAVDVLSFAALLTWLIRFHKSGEAREQRLAMPWMAGREEELINQLNELNAALMKVSKK